MYVCYYNIYACCAVCTCVCVRVYVCVCVCVCVMVLCALYRYQRSELISLLLTPAPAEARKRLPSQSNPHLANSIREEAALCLKQHKGDWPCYFFTRLTTFVLPAGVYIIICLTQQHKQVLSVAYY